MGASVIPAGTGNTEKHLKLIRDLGITGIACTPSYALYLAETMEKLASARRISACVSVPSVPSPGQSRCARRLRINWD
jgi:phenylacetate-coenzyme A ligase PaaK-like adenylate-forming protein